MADADLVDEREPIGMVELDADLGQASRNGARLQRFRFPPQDHGAKVGRAGRRPAHPGVRRHVDGGGRPGRHRSRSTGRRSSSSAGTPASLIPNDFVRTTVIEDSLLRIGRWVAEEGIAAGAGDAYRAGREPSTLPRPPARELLLRRPPADRRRRARRACSAPPTRAPLDAAVRIALALDGGTLAIQGPPGTGKTYTGARMILALVAAGKTVGVTANSHKVIGNVLDAVVAAAKETGARTATGTRIVIGQKPAGDEEPACADAEPLGRRARHRGRPGRRHAPRRRGHGLALVRARHGGERRRPPRRRGRPVQPRQHRGCLARRPLARAPRRPPAARPAPQGEPPARRRAERPGPSPRRRPGRAAARHHAARARPLPREDVAPPSRDLRLHERALLRVAAASDRGARAPGASRGRDRLAATGIRWLPVAHAGNDTRLDRGGRGDRRGRPRPARRRRPLDEPRTGSRRRCGSRTS